MLEAREKGFKVLASNRQTIKNEHGALGIWCRLGLRRCNRAPLASTQPKRDQSVESPLFGRGVWSKARLPLCITVITVQLHMMRQIYQSMMVQKASDRMQSWTFKVNAPKWLVLEETHVEFAQFPPSSSGFTNILLFPSFLLFQSSPSPSLFPCTSHKF